MEINKFKFVIRFNNLNNFQKDDKVTHIIYRECQELLHYDLEKIKKIENYKELCHIAIIASQYSLFLKKISDQDKENFFKIFKEVSIPMENSFESIWMLFAEHFDNDINRTLRYFKDNYIFDDKDNISHWGPSTGFIAITLLNKLPQIKKIHIYGMNFGSSNNYKNGFKLHDEHWKNEIKLILSFMPKCIIHVPSKNLYHSYI